MIFSSPIFLFFFLPLLLSGYFLANDRGRNILLLAASLLFYAWGEAIFVLVLLVSIAFNFAMGLWIEKVPLGKGARWLLALAVAGNLGLLAFFKYGNFLADNLNWLLHLLHLRALSVPPIHLPLGISFFTFHALSYVVDVYRREVPALRHPVRFALYISFFPQSIAGPIIRYSDVAHQLRSRQVTAEGFAEGVRRFILGLAKKMLIANAVALPADEVFRLPVAELTTGLAWLGIVCYTLQIYFDFSGYSDMAIGLGRMFGFQFRENFAHPYIARSVTEFWRRWHISLSTWFRDYLYIPMGGNRCGQARLCFNLAMVFFLCGLWHGASWTFVLWGLYHGTFLTLERLGLSHRLAEKRWRLVSHLYTLAVVMGGWLLFRAETLTQAGAMLKAMAGFGSGTGDAFAWEYYWNHELKIALIAGIICSLPVMEWFNSFQERILDGLALRSRARQVVNSLVGICSLATLAVLFTSSAMQMATGTYSPFIYFRF